ncbi:MAG: cephalosporin hydroxylase family protein [Acidimicrobiales bacterium]
MSLGPRFLVRTPDGDQEFDAYSEKGFHALVDLYARSGWQRKISYEVTWLGIPIIQTPEDILMIQELVWKVRPDVIVETGVAHGGGLVLYASLLELLGRGRVIGVDVEIRKYNRLAIESHPMSKRISLIDGSSTDEATLDCLRTQLIGSDNVMVMLDSNHSRDHVRRELELYGQLVTPGSYLVVFDSIMAAVADAPAGRPEWATDNPLAAVEDYLSDHPEFRQDPAYERLGVTYCHGGFLHRRSP